MREKIRAAPTLVYPESDGEPMAESGRHVRLLLDMIETIDRLFGDVPDVHVCGNMFLYYEEGNPRKVISPDVFMVRGVSKKDLRTYKTWEQQPYLDFVLELASPSTYTKDFNEKKAIYEQILRVQEYCIYLQKEPNRRGEVPLAHLKKCARTFRIYYIRSREDFLLTTDHSQLK